MSLENQVVAKEASKAVSEYLLSSDDGVQARKRAGIIFTILGIVWILIILGANWIAVSAPKPNPMPTKMFIITIGLGVVSIIAGLVQLILIKTSAKFRKWANKDFEKDLEVITNPKKQLELVLTFLFMLLII